jgi:hypothetical protein
MFGKVLYRHRGLVGQHIDDLCQSIMKSGHHRVDLDPVARGQQQCLRDVLTVEQLVQDLAGVRTTHRNSLQHVHRCAAVGQPHDQKTHRPSASLRVCELQCRTEPEPGPLALFQNRASGGLRLHRQRRTSVPVSRSLQTAASTRPRPVHNGATLVVGDNGFRDESGPEWLYQRAAAVPLYVGAGAGAGAGVQARRRFVGDHDTCDQYVRPLTGVAWSGVAVS